MSLMMIKYAGGWWGTTSYGYTSAQLRLGYVLSKQITSKLFVCGK